MHGRLGAGMVPCQLPDQSQVEERSRHAGAIVSFAPGLQGLLMAVVGEQLQRIQRLVEGKPPYHVERELG